MLPLAITVVAKSNRTAFAKLQVSQSEGNPEEEDYLNSKEGQETIAQSIVNAIKCYKYSLDNKTIGTSTGK